MATPTYAQRADVVFYAGGEARLLELADHDNDGIEDTDLIDETICRAEGWVNSYIRQQFETPIVTPSGAIAEVTAGYTVHLLKSALDALTESDIFKQEQRVEWLEGIAKGRIDPGVNQNLAPSPKNSPKVTDRDSAVKIVSRSNFEGYT